MRWRQMVTKIGVVATLSLSVATSSCLERKRSASGDPASQTYDREDASFPLYQTAWDAATRAAATRALNDAFSRFIPSGLSREQMIAVSACAPCLEQVSGPLLQSYAAARGTLPQILVPQIRVKVKDDGTLKTLNQLGVFGDVLKGLFATDQKVTDKIRSGLNDSLQGVFPGANLLRDMPNFYFDGLVTTGDRATGTARVKVADVAAKWLVVTAVPNMWEGKTPIRFGHHGLQLLSFANTVADWNYIFGLTAASDRLPYGGMVIDARKGTNAAIQAMDPRKDGDAVGIFTGDYRISLPSARNLVELLNTKRETWQRDAQAVGLGEQALVWRAAAQAFHYARPRSSQRVASMFDARRGMLPAEATIVPLLFLPGMAYLLDGPFVDEDKRLIYQDALVNERERHEARLQDKTALGRAIGLWAEELRDIGDLGSNNIYIPTQDMQKRLRDGAPRLKQATQFVVQNILSRHTVIGKPGRDGLSPISLVEDNNVASLKATAETLATLIELELRYPSPLVRRRLEGLFHWFMAKVLTPRLAPGQEPLSIEEALWTYSALTNYSRLPEESMRAPWLGGATEIFANAIKTWGTN